MSYIRGADILEPDQIDKFADLLDLPVYKLVEALDSLRRTSDTHKNLPASATAEALLQLASQRAQEHSCTPPHPELNIGYSAFQNFAGVAPLSKVSCSSYTLSDPVRANDTQNDTLGQQSNFEATDDFYALNDREYSAQEVTAFTAHQDLRSLLARHASLDCSFPNHVEGREGMDEGDVAGETIIGSFDPDFDHASLEHHLMTGPCSRDWDERLLPLVRDPCAY